MRRYEYRKHYAWDAQLAYLAGLMASDGCMVNDSRHLVMTSKDIEIISYVQRIAHSNQKVRTKTGQFGTSAYHYQFSDVALYDFLLRAGITPAKSKTIEQVAVPDDYYADFLRGYFDGDGTVYGYRDTRWRNSYMYYTGFISASLAFLLWIQASNKRMFGTSCGKIAWKRRTYTLTYAKTDSQALYQAMYFTDHCYRLERKRTKFRNFIISDPYAKITVDARVLESVDRLA